MADDPKTPAEPKVKDPAAQPAPPELVTETPAEPTTETPDAEAPLTQETPATEPDAEAPLTQETPASPPPAPSGTDQQGRQLYDVKCSECGADTQVPFQPNPDRPVYCRDCYIKKRQ